MQNERIDELRKNTLIIAIANIGSKAIVFIMAPLYSFYLTTQQYGTMDLITTTAGLLVPIICFDIFEATFRYTSDPKYEDGMVLCSSLAVTAIGSGVAMCLLLIIALFSKANLYIIYTGVIVILEAINSVLRQFARGQALMKVFSFSGIVDAITLLGLNLIFMVLLKYHLNGWLISYLIAKIATTLYLIVSTKAFRYFSIQMVERDYIFQFIKFCIPLVPTAIMWWIMNASDRYVIAFFLGTAATGVYSVANKLPAILSVFERIFYQAWQTTAINSLNDERRDEFFSTILTKYILIISIGVLVLFVVAKPMILILFAPEYAEAWKCLPFLLLGILFHAIGGNLGSMYTVFKETKGAFTSSLVGALSNTVLNFVAVPFIGIVGAAITTLIGYVVTYIYRWFDVKKYVQLRLNHKELWAVYIAFPIQCALYYWDSPFSYALRLAIALSIILLNYKSLMELIVRR